MAKNSGIVCLTHDTRVFLKSAAFTARILSSMLYMPVNVNVYGKLLFAGIIMLLFTAQPFLAEV